MADPKGYKLYVNVSAAQAKRRLKGFGHGVRKVHSAGRNKAVVIHSATGRNLAALQAKFSDVGHSEVERDLGEPIENLPNVGVIAAGWLRDAGIRTVSELEQWGPAAAYRAVRQRQPSATLNLLWALAAGLQKMDWRDLSDRDKERLLVEAMETTSR